MDIHTGHVYMSVFIHVIIYVTMQYMFTYRKFNYHRYMYENCFLSRY